MLYILPLEPLEERYTKQWMRWFDKSLKARHILYQNIYGEAMTSTVEVGTVLDAVGTNAWKFSQLLNVCRLFKSGAVRNGDKFFSADVWHPGLEAIPYMATLSNLQVEVYGFLHAGSYTTQDFAAPLADWAQYFERGWAKICKKVFTGTQYHRQKFAILRLQGCADNIVVTGYPFDTEEIRNMAGEVKPVAQRERVIVFPHRFDAEKGPDRFLDLMELLWKRGENFQVVFTTSRPKFRSNDPKLIERLQQCEFPYQIKAGLTKQQYYQELAKARVFVSTTVEENFGLCLAESMCLGCTPVVVNNFSHPELVQQDDRFLFNSNAEALLRISLYLDNPVDVSRYASPYNDSVDRILDGMEY